MSSKKNEQDWQAQDDAYTMARYQEIMSDKNRAARAIKAAKKQAESMSRQADVMKKAADVSRDKVVYKKQKK